MTPGAPLSTAGPLRSRWADTNLATAIAFGLVVGYAASIAVAYISHIWLLDSSGKPIVFDFMVFWSAGRMALHGASVAVYDPHLLRVTEIATVGHHFPDMLPWWYPPLFLCVAALLAGLPFLPAFILWITTTLLLQASVIAAIARQSRAFLIACAPPWVLFAVLNGQNGFLTASIIGLTLLLLERRPALSGIVLGLLSYKPQFGLLFPIALACGGYWRTFSWACISVAFWTGLSAVIFGPDTLHAFLRDLAGAHQFEMVSGTLPAHSLQSVYGLVRSAGASDMTGSAVQLVFSFAWVIALAALWRSHAPFALKAAGLASMTLLVTPYVLTSDFALLSVATAFLFRHRPFDRLELLTLALVLLTVASALWHPPSACVFASMGFAALVLRRFWFDGGRWRDPSINPTSGSRDELAAYGSPAGGPI